jgi:DUF917 family protein
MTSVKQSSEWITGQKLEIRDIEALAIGTWILGTGGGGNPYHSLLNMRELYKSGHRVNLIQPEELDDEALVGVLSNMGAPLVGEERLADPQFAMKPVLMMEKYLGRPFEALMALEIGGGNGLQPFLVASLTGQPVVDADQMGRAYPEAQMTSVAVNNLRCYPLTLADIRDNETIIPKAESWRWMERISRKVCTEMGSIASTCKAPRTGREVKDFCILHTVSKAISIGNAVLDARAQNASPIQAILDMTGGKRLFKGKVVDVNRRTTEGFLRGSTRIMGLDENADDEFLLHFQNEFSLGLKNDKPEVMTPDLICVVDSLSGEGIGTDVIRYGQRVDVLALPAPEVFLTPAGLDAVGPRAFGFDCDYKSVFLKE